MRTTIFKAAAALAVLAGTSAALAQPYCSSPNITAGGEVNPGNPQTVMDTITVTGGPGSIANMAVTVNVACTWDADATLILVHNGVGLNLTNWNGGGGDNYTNTRFIDGTTPITDGIAPFTGDFSPEGGTPGYFGIITLPGTFLANFAGWAGSDGNGAWDLIVDDDFPAFDDVTLVDWCIDFNPGAPPPPPPPPPGDDCLTPIIAVDGANTLNTVGATTDSTFGCGFGVGKDVHFQYTATADGVAIISTCGATSFDTVMMLGSSCGGSDYGCLDDFCGLQTEMAVAVVTGQVIHVTVGGYNGQSGTGVLNINVAPPSSGDTCASPIIAVDGSNPLDNVGASADSSFPCGFNVGRDIHYTYTATSDGVAVFNTCNSSFGTVMMLGTTCGGSDLGCFDGCEIGTLVTSGQTVHVTVGGYNGSGGTGTLEIAVIPPSAGDDCGSPIIASDGANALENAGATTDSSFSCGFGVAKDVHFVYTASSSGVALFSTCGTGFDTVMLLGSSCGGSDYGCLDDSCGFQTEMSVSVTAGQVVHVTIGGYNGDSGTGTLNISVAPPSVNDECLTATVLVGEGTYPFDNTGASTNGSLSCGFGGSQGFNDVWYEYRPSFTGFATVETCGLTDMDTQLAVFDACNGGSELACNDDSCGTLQSKLCPFPVTANQSVWIRLSGWAAGDRGTGDMLIASAPAPGPYIHPGAGSDEEEPCNQGGIDMVNVGCNAFEQNPPGIPVWGSISCGETIVGTAWCNANVNRDTDAFIFTLDSDATVTFTGQAEFPALMFILSSTCPWEVFANATSGDCDNNLSLSFFLTAGTYNLWMGSNGFGTQIDCGTNDRYWVTMSVDTGCPAACDGDVNCDFALDGFDVEVQEKAVGGDMTDYCQPDPDFNGDFALDGFDVEAVEVVVGGGPCP